MPSPRLESILRLDELHEILMSPPDRDGHCDDCGVYDALHMDPATEGYFEFCHDCWIGQLQRRRSIAK